MEHGHAHEFVDAIMSRRGDACEQAHAKGIYYAFCRAADGAMKWRAQATNIVTTVGKNLELDTYLSGAGYTVSGPYMGLISSNGFRVTAAADTLIKHDGWKEAGRQDAPTYEGMRKTMAFHAAADGSKTLLQPTQFTFTSDGFIEGAFMVLGPGATNQIDTMVGTLHSAGVFTIGKREVTKGDSLFMNYAYAI